MFFKRSSVLCVSCRFTDKQNEFKNNEVNVNARITTNEVSEEVSGTFVVNCAKCSRCNKILFTRMSTFKSLKKEANKYFKDLYPLSEIELLSITM